MMCQSTAIVNKWLVYVPSSNVASITFMKFVVVLASVASLIFSVNSLNALLFLVSSPKDTVSIKGKFFPNFLWPSFNACVGECIMMISCRLYLCQKSSSMASLGKLFYNRKSPICMRGSSTKDAKCNLLWLSECLQCRVAGSSLIWNTGYKRNGHQAAC